MRFSRMLGVNTLVCASLVLGSFLSCKTSSTNNDSELTAIRQDSFDPQTKAFTVKCDIKADNTGVFNSVLVKYSGNVFSNEAGSTSFKFSDPNRNSQSLDCVTGNVSLRRHVTNESTNFELSSEMTDMPGSIISGETGSPQNISVVLKSSFGSGEGFYKGTCKPVATNSLPTAACEIGFNLLGLSRSCEKAPLPNPTPHFAELCKSVGGSASFCKSGTILCSMGSVGDRLAKSPYTGYTLNGKKVSCPAVTPRPRVGGSTQLPIACENAGGITLPDCKNTGPKCESICTKKI